MQNLIFFAFFYCFVHQIVQKYKRTKKGGKTIKTVEELRMWRLGENQHQFAERIGMSYRTYQDRIQGKKPDWRLSELVEICKIAAEHNDELCITIGGKSYIVNIREAE